VVVPSAVIASTAASPFAVIPSEAAQRPTRDLASRKSGPLATLLLIVALAACSPRSGVELGEVQTLSTTTNGGAAPTIALAPEGTRAMAWVSAPHGGTDGRVNIAVGDARPVQLRDSLGPIEAHGESPPKLAFARDGSLHVLYVVGKVVPGRRFPLAALRHAQSRDGGRTWSAPATVTDDSTFGSHNFHALHAAADGTIWASWLDGREGRSAAYVAHSTDGGTTWSANRRVEMGGEACPCCRTAMASAPDGTIYLAWRKVFPGSVRDIVVATSRDGGATWSDPVPIHADRWVFDGCPHAGPALAVDSIGRLHAVWWTGKEGRSGVWYTRSDDGARTFREPVAMDTAAVYRPAHVQLALGDGGIVAAAWDDGTVQLPRILLRVSRDGGATFGGEAEVSDPARAAQFPVLGARGRTLTVAWSEQGSEALAHEQHDMAKMKDPKVPQGLKAVGGQQVLVRTGQVGP
jgi:hypothetical protein